MTTGQKLRLFVDSNVVMDAMTSRWGLDKAVISLCSAGICRMILADAVREEVEHNLLLHAQTLPRTWAEQLMRDYDAMIDRCHPEMVSHVTQAEIHANRALIRHEADVPVLLAAIKSKPDWLLTNNTKHFNKSVAQKTRLRIATPAELFRALAILLS